MSKVLAGLFILGAGLVNLYLMWTRALGAEVRSWWWFIGCGTIGVLLNAAYTEWRKETKP